MVGVVRERYSDQLSRTRSDLEPRLELRHLPLHQLVEPRLFVAVITLVTVQVGTDAPAAALQEQTSDAAICFIKLH